MESALVMAFGVLVIPANASISLLAAPILDDQGVNGRLIWFDGRSLKFAPFLEQADIGNSYDDKGFIHSWSYLLTGQLIAVAVSSDRQLPGETLVGTR